MTSLWDKKQIAKAFTAVASHYDSYAILQHEVADRLLERCIALEISPQWIADIGSGTGYLSRQLTNVYQQAKMVEVDIAEGMLSYSRSQSSNQHYHLLADAESLPLASECVDMLVSNLMMQWSHQLDNVTSEMMRILRPQGSLFFTSLGPDTFCELRSAWAGVDDGHHVHDFVDMHIIGDLLVQQGFVDPVMDREIITVYFDDVMQIMKDIKAIGAQNADPRRSATLTGKTRMKNMIDNYEKYRHDNNKLPVTYEVIYGYAKTPLHRLSSSDAGRIRIPLSSIGKIKR